MTWHTTLKVTDVEPGKVGVVEIDGERVAICRTDEGDFYAIADLCSHDGGALDQGELLGERIECPRHGAQFDIKTGRALTLPAVRPIKSYPLRVVDDTIEVELA
ncbi:MAG: non-heme iron oxygenase ferredoxin subunit [Dehalococcoidia bacterium]|nr:non-heme iron oxygenase ferredoxin subunit [Dehalococcoidia bacterium]MCA9825396.1 non-heme iron oxygenase ferredoxin subunit [Dehalococcoidia bacterium]MCA9843969.1 non-heme iron oxygenase ferredoxin subunit [Dehalococcoidia bacterium]MCA9852805.1 non-heme iron oxygenase ferredoxin subunit [Dehalococcoidia bacterium]